MPTARNLFPSDSTDVQALFARFKGEPRNVGIFMGAGVSCAAPCNRPLWGQYLELVIKRCQELGRINRGEVKRLERRARQGEMLAVAEECKKHIEVEFAKLLQDTFHPESLQPSEAHELIARLGLRIHLTTNFDRALQIAVMSSTAKDLNQATWHEPQKISSCLADDRPFVIHLHGNAEDPNKCILTRTDYSNIISSFEALPFRELIRSIFLNFTILFVGFGMEDRHLDFVLETLAYQWGGSSRTHYALLPNSREQLIEHLRFSRNLRVIPYDSRDNHIAVTDFLRALLSIREADKETRKTLSKNAKGKTASWPISNAGFSVPAPLTASRHCEVCGDPLRSKAAAIWCPNCGWFQY